MYSRYAQLRAIEEAEIQVLQLYSKLVHCTLNTVKNHGVWAKSFGGEAAFVNTETTKYVRRVQSSVWRQTLDWPFTV